MISIIYFYDTTKDMVFIEKSIFCSSVKNNTNKIIIQLLEEIEDEAITPNNKSTVITCLITTYMMKHLGMHD